MYPKVFVLNEDNSLDHSVYLCFGLFFSSTMLPVVAQLFNLILGTVRSLIGLVVKEDEESKRAAERVKNGFERAAEALQNEELARR